MAWLAHAAVVLSHQHRVSRQGTGPHFTPFTPTLHTGIGTVGVLPLCRNSSNSMWGLQTMTRLLSQSKKTGSVVALSWVSLLKSSFLAYQESEVS